MDDDTAIDRLLEAGDLTTLISLVSLAYQTGWMEANGRSAPHIRSTKLRSLLMHARRNHWTTIEAVRAETEEDPPAPAWLRKIQGPSEEEEDGRHGAGC